MIVSSVITLAFAFLFGVFPWKVKDHTCVCVHVAGYCSNADENTVNFCTLHLPQ